MWEKISNRLLELLKTNTGIQSVYDFEAANLEGSPSATLTSSENEGEYSTTSENRRIYAFVLRLYVARPSGTDNERKAEKTMRQLIDSVLNLIDKNWYISGITDETGYQFLFMEAAPSRWAYADRETTLRVAEIRIRIHYNIDVTLIS